MQNNSKAGNGIDTIFSDSTVNFITRLVPNAAYFIFISIIIKYLGEKNTVN